MSNLIPIEFKNQRVILTEQLAKIYETDTDNIIHNFNNHKGNFKEGLHFYLLKGEELRVFKRSVNDIHVVKPNINQLYLWTERGANRHCKILDTDKAWEQFDNLEETYFRIKENNHKQLSAMDQLRLQYEVLGNHEEKINELNAKVDDLALTMNITDGQAKTIKKRIDKRVVRLCFGNESNAYLNIALRKKVYIHVWKMLKDYLDVVVYHNILRKDYSSALKYIDSIVLQGALLKEVQESNRCWVVSES